MNTPPRSQLTIPEAEDDSIGEVYWFVGFVTFLAHGLEMELVNLAVALKSGDQRLTVETTWDDLFDKHFRETLGSLFTAIRQRAALSPETEAAVSNAVVKRHRLAHHFFREHDEDLFSRAGRRAMIDDLRDIGHAILQADALLTSTTDTLWEKLGVTVDMRLAAVEDMRAAGRIRDAAV